MQDILDELESAVPATVTPVDHDDLARRARFRIRRRRVAASTALVMLAVGGGVSFAWLRSGDDLITDGPAGSTEVVTGSDADPAESRDDGVVDMESTDTTEPAPLDLATLEEGFGSWTEVSTLDLGELIDVYRVEELDDGRVLIAAKKETTADVVCQAGVFCEHVLGILDPTTGGWRELPPIPDEVGPTDLMLQVHVAGDRVLAQVVRDGLRRFAWFDADAWSWTAVPDPTVLWPDVWITWTGETLVLAPSDGATVADGATIPLERWTVGDVAWRSAALAPGNVANSAASPALIGDDLYHVGEGGRAAAVYHLADDTWTALPALSEPMFVNFVVTLGDTIAVAGNPPDGVEQPAYLALEDGEWVAHPAPIDGEKMVIAWDGFVSVFEGYVVGGRWWYDVGAGWEVSDAAFRVTGTGVLIAPSDGAETQAQTLRYRTGVETWVGSAPAPFTEGEVLDFGLLGEQVIMVTGTAGGEATAWLFDPTG